MRRILVASALVITAVLASAAPALAKTPPPPFKSTLKCTHGTYQGYCGTQTDQETPPMSMVSGGPPAQNRFVYANPNSTTSPLTDFFWFRFNGGSSFIAEFAPNGVASNYCVAQVSYLSGVKLRACNGSQFQRWTPVGVPGGYEWQNGATDNIIQSNGEGLQLRGVVPGMSAQPTQTWNFVG